MSDPPIRYPDATVYGELLTCVADYTSGRGGPRLAHRIRGAQTARPVPLLGDLYLVLVDQQKKVAQHGVKDILAYSRLEGALAMLLAVAELNTDAPGIVES